MKMLFRNGISLRPIYLARFTMLLFNSFISSILFLAEKKNFSKRIKETAITKPPVFIIGHWRTGSTLLHQFLSLDPQLTVPTMVQTTIPDHFLFSTKYYIPILKKALPETRPMDQVPLSPLQAQEDEFALLRMGCESPLEKLIFPSRGGYFLSGYKNYVGKGVKLDTWKKNLFTFYRKITLVENKRIVSKNPYHTMRMELLAEMFPGAKFIHITRDPLVVIPSTIRMWNIVAEQNKLKKGWTGPSISEAASVLKSYLDHVAICSEKLDNPFVEIRFEELEENPLEILKKLYNELDMPWTVEFQTSLTPFIEASRGYEKNTYTLGAEERVLIENICAP